MNHHTPNHFSIRANVVRSAIAEIGKRIAEWIRRRIREKLIKYVLRQKKVSKSYLNFMEMSLSAMHRQRHSPTFLVILSNIRLRRTYRITQLHNYIPMFTFVSHRNCVSHFSNEFYLRRSRAPKIHNPHMKKGRRNHMRCNVYNCAVGFSPHKY